MNKEIIKRIAEQNGLGYSETTSGKGGSIIDDSGKVVKTTHSDFANEELEILYLNE